MKISNTFKFKNKEGQPCVTSCKNFNGSDSKAGGFPLSSAMTCIYLYYEQAFLIVAILTLIIEVLCAPFKLSYIVPYFWNNYDLHFELCLF